MEPSIRILYLEDDSTDSAPIQEMLQSAGLDLSMTTVQSGEAFREALAGDEHDLVLADSGFSLRWNIGFAPCAADAARGAVHLLFRSPGRGYGHRGRAKAQRIMCLKRSSRAWRLSSSARCMKPKTGANASAPSRPFGSRSEGLQSLTGFLAFFWAPRMKTSTGTCPGPHARCHEQQVRCVWIHSG